MKTLSQNEKGEWMKAKPEPYYPNLIEKITHFFGKHWYYQADKCVMCGIYPKATRYLSRAWCECGQEVLQDPKSQIYEAGSTTNIICSNCGLQTNWDLDAPVPLLIKTIR